MDALEAEQIQYSQIIVFLDEIEPWGKQHVVIYDGPTYDIAHWRDADWVRKYLEIHELNNYLNTQIPLALPETLTLSSIQWSPTKLRITAVERREGALREPELDREGEVEDLEVIYKAYIYRIVRGLSIFEWDLVSNQAFFQITQLPSGQRYEDASTRFSELFNNILQVQDFTSVDLRDVISRLHAVEQAGTPEARSHGIGYRTLLGRTLTGRSSLGAGALLGETVIDDAMASIREVGVGHLGNFYWLPDPTGDRTTNPLETEVHVELVGEYKRVNFLTTNCEQDFRYVLQRIRNISQQTP